MNQATLTCVTREGRQIVAPLDTYLSPDRREMARVEANAWIKRLRLVPYGDVSMRDRFTYQGDSLWWFTELYLHKMRRLDTAVAAVLALEAARDQHGAASMIVEAENIPVREAARAFGAVTRIPVELRGSPAGRPRGGWSSYLIGLTATLSRWRPSGGTRPVARPAVAAFVHTAFWRPDADDAGAYHETYIGPVLDAVAKRVSPGDLQCIGVGPRRNFRARRWWDPVIGAAAVHEQITPIERLAKPGALDGALDLWRQREALASALVSGEAIRAAALFRGCDLWPVLEPELDAAARLQWPWSARAMDEAGAALDALSPRAVVTYAEAGGWGRALVLEARRRGIPSVGLQHGFIYRHWLNYLHEPDEIAAAATPGCPIPDRTLVFDEYARAHLLSAGHFPDATVTVTGSARLDDLAARVAAASATRDATRASLLGGLAGLGGAGGLAGGEERLVVLTAKHSEMGTRLADLIAAVRTLSKVRLVIKPHPAETPGVYTDLAGGAPNVSVADARADLARLLAAADAVVTMNSTVAIDGLVLGIPALVVGRPTNLSPFVDAGVMAGADGAEAIRAGLESVLYDAGVRQSLAEAARRFTGRFGMRADGRAADRTAAEILALANASPVTPSDHA